MVVATPQTADLQAQAAMYAERLANVLRKQDSQAVQTHLATQQRPNIVEWAAKNYYIPQDSGRPKLIKLMPHQKIILDLFFEPRLAQYFGCAPNFQTCVFSTIKKSGKTAIAGLVARWIAETWGSHVEVYSMANDLEQARGRIYAAALASIELDPRYELGAKGIPGLWRIIERDAKYIPTHSSIRAVSSDYKGEAGSNPVATLWSELWGYSSEASLRLWEELTPVPTRPRSIRYVETYAGYEGESGILNDLEDKIKGKQSHRVTHEDLKALDIEWPWLDQDLPFYVHQQSRTIAYWDQGVEARRMLWQTPEYYQAQASDLRESAFKRLHLNIRVSNAEEFIPIQWWDRLAFTSNLIEYNTPLVIGADASVTGDCTAISGVTRDPSRPDAVVQVLSQIWTPKDGKALDYSLTIEPALRRLCTGHIHPLRDKCDDHAKIAELGVCIPSKPYNVVQIAYDEFQLHDLMTRLRNEGIAWCRKFGQQADRSVADKALYDLIKDQRIHHTGDAEAREHIMGAAAKVPTGDNTRLRIVKKGKASKIDFVIATSMAANECLRLSLG